MLLVVTLRSIVVTLDTPGPVYDSTKLKLAPGVVCLHVGLLLMLSCVHPACVSESIWKDEDCELTETSPLLGSTPVPETAYDQPVL